MFCKDTVYRITTQDMMFLAGIEVKSGGAIVMIDPVRLDQVPGKPITSLKRALVPLLDKRMTVCGTYMYARLADNDPHRDAYIQTTTGLIIPGVQTNLSKRGN